MAGEARGSSTLLPWAVTEETMVQAAPLPPAKATALLPALSVVDRTSSWVFINQALVFECALDAAKLAAALAEALALFPTLGCRATKDTDGEWLLCQPGAGALLTIGTSTASLATLAPRPTPLVAPLADLGGQLFGHLPSLPVDSVAAAAADRVAAAAVDSVAAAAVPLLQVALIALRGGSATGSGVGGCVLGLRASHLVADFATLRALLHHLARAYSGRPLAPADVPIPAAALVEALAQVAPPPGAQPWNYLPVPSNFNEQFAALLAAPPLQGLVLHLPPARLAALKAAAATEAAVAAAAAAAAGNGDGNGSVSGDALQPAWVSTNNALMAWLWRMLATLPCRRGKVTAFYQPMDMRGRLPAAAYTACKGAQPPRFVYGNLIAGAFTPEMDVAAMSLGAVAVALRRTLVSDAAKFGPDLAHVARDEASGVRCCSLALRPILCIAEAAAAGRRPLMMASQLALDYAADADFGGQLPVGVVCTFGRTVLPVAHYQPAPPAAGGGIYIYLWLHPDEADELVTALTAEPWASAVTAGGERGAA